MIESIINSDKAELTQNTKKGSPVVLSTRVRLARNLVDAPFPERASTTQRSDVMSRCADQISDLMQMKHGVFLILPNFLTLKGKSSSNATSLAENSASLNLAQAFLSTKIRRAQL